MVELLRRNVLRTPRSARGVRHRTATIVGVHQVRGIVHVDPQIMMIAVRTVPRILQRPATIGRAEHRCVLQIDHVGVLVIGDDVRVIKGALTDVATPVRKCPRCAGIVALEQTTVIVLHDGVHAIRIRRAYRHTDATNEATRQPLVARDLGPRLAAVSALEQAAASATAGHLEFLAVRLPQRCVHHVRIVAVDRDVDRAGLVVAIQHLAPTLAAIGALEHAALCTRHAVLAERRDEHDVRIRGMNADLGDAVTLLEADMRPRLAGIGAAVNAVARHDVAANARLTHADVDDVRIAFAYCDRTNRRALDLAVGDRCPIFTAISRFPEPASHRAKVRFLWSALRTARGD